MDSKVENVEPKVQKEAEAQRDGVINPQKTISINFYTVNKLNVLDSPIPILYVPFNAVSS